MPDPDETATATAEADAGAVTVADPNQLVQSTEEPGAAAEQEATDQAEAKPDEKAGAEQKQEGKTEGGDAMAQAREALAVYRKANPEAAEELFGPEVVPEEAVDPLAERENAIAAKEALFESRGAAGQAFQEVNTMGSGGRQTLDTSITAWGVEVAASVNKLLGADDPKLAPETASAKMTEFRQQAELYTYQATVGGSFLQAKNVLMSSAAAQNLTADERKSVGELGWQAALTDQGQAYADLFAPFLAAAQRAAPKRVLAQAKEEAAKAGEDSKKLLDFLKMLPGNGANRAALNADGKTAPGRSDAEKLLDPATPVPELEKIRARQRAARIGA